MYLTIGREIIRAALLVRAWIEMTDSPHTGNLDKAALLVRAWIEMLEDVSIAAGLMGRSPRESVD